MDQNQNKEKDEVETDLTGRATLAEARRIERRSVALLRKARATLVRLQTKTTTLDPPSP